MTAITEPFFPTQTDVSYTWSGEGWIEFANDGDRIRLETSRSNGRTKASDGG
jgi:hypothetical protein